jgi:hypothetical protein
MAPPSQRQIPHRHRGRIAWCCRQAWDEHAELSGVARLVSFGYVDWGGFPRNELSALSCLAGRPGALSRRAGAPRGFRDRRDEPSVRAGSVPQRSTTGISGHQRSLTVQRNRRSLALWLKQLGQRTRAIRIVVPKGWGSSPLGHPTANPQLTGPLPSDNHGQRHASMSWPPIAY